MLQQSTEHPWCPLLSFLYPFVQREKRPDPNYMEALQTDIMPAMRAILIDWLVEVAQEYKLHSETLFQAVGLVDRYLSIVPVPRNQLQLIGVSCMLLASKYEEIYSPQVGFHEAIHACLLLVITFALRILAKQLTQGWHMGLQSY